MVKAELNYNPYKLETSVKFNGKEPHVNSFIEKYRNTKLQEWLPKVPYLFREELNGFNFDLDFIGTEMEFNEVKEVFKQSVSGEEYVNVNHKQCLMNRQEKVDQIKLFLDWLAEAQSDYFDYGEFRDNNENLLIDLFPFIVINGMEEDTGEIPVGVYDVEYVNDINKLMNAKLDNTPILVCLRDEYIELVQAIVSLIINNDSVTEKQIFFLNRNNNGFEKIKRVLEDLGIKKPVVVDSINDKVIKDYIDTYPLCQYITDLLSALRETVNSIDTAIGDERKKIEDANKQEYEKLEILNNRIEKIEQSIDSFEQSDFSPDRSALDAYKKEYFDKLEKWKEKSVVITGDANGEKEANHLVDSIRKWNGKLLHNLSEYILDKSAVVVFKYSDYYHISGEDENNILLDLVNATCSWDSEPDLIKLKKSLLECREAKWVEEKHFKFMQKAEVQKVLQGEYDVSKWRLIAHNSFFEISRTEIGMYYEKLLSFEVALKRHYLTHLKSLKESAMREKNQILNSLSDDVKDVEREKDWLEQFKERLEVVERT